MAADTDDPDAFATKRDLDDLRGRINDDMRALLEEFAERIEASVGQNVEGSGHRISQKYRPLMDYLRALTYNTRNMTFSQVEKIIKARLPASAKNYAAVWWSNSWGPSQCSAWLAAGWRVAAVDQIEETVRFERILEELDE